MIYVGLGDLPCASVGSGAPRGISKVGDRRGESSKPQEHVSVASRKCGCSSSPGVAVGCAAVTCPQVHKLPGTESKGVIPGEGEGWKVSSEGRCGRDGKGPLPGRHSAQKSSAALCPASQAARRVNKPGFREHGLETQ